MMNVLNCGYIMYMCIVVWVIISVYGVNVFDDEDD